ncbi:hypothetical protein Tco_0662241 [Tanacetum coccineum]
MALAWAGCFSASPYGARSGVGGVRSDWADAMTQPYPALLQSNEIESEVISIHRDAKRKKKESFDIEDSVVTKTNYKPL